MPLLRQPSSHGKWSFMNTWKNVNSVKELLALAMTIGFFLVVMIPFLVIARGFVYRHLHGDIDGQLLSVAKSVRLILPEDYHERATTADAIGEVEYQEIEDKLTALAESFEVRYIWTDTLRDGKVYLTSCNRPEDPNKSKTKIFYFMPYEQGVSLEEMRAFSSDVPVYATFSDAWGNFRAVFVPIKNRDGSVSLACAEYTVSHVAQILRKADLIFITGLGCFIVAILPLFFLSMRRMKQGQAKLKEKNMQLAQSREWLQTTLYSIGEGVFVLDAEGRICSMNPVAEQLSGWNFPDAKGKRHHEVLQFVASESGEAVMPSAIHIDRVFSSSDVITLRRDLSLMAKNGRSFRIMGTAAPIRQEGENGITGAVLIVRDETERIKIEEERKQSQKMQALGQLTGGIAHDVNNMLGGISGATELLEMALASDPKLMKYISLIKSATERTTNLIGKMLAFSRKGKIVSRQFNMHTIIQETVALLERSIDRRIEVRLSLQAEKHGVNGDPSQMQNGLLNLVLNARDAMPEGGLLHILTANVTFDQEYCSVDNDLHPQHYIQVSIQDTGQGIPPDIQDRIFEPFYSTKEVGKGTGLGLASVYGTVQEHKGTIKFYTEQGKGTVFHLYLPLSQGLEQLACEEKEVVIQPGKGTILLVDDEEILRQTGMLLLQQLGYTVIVAKDGAEAVSVYEERQHEIDCVLLDIVMPVMNGKEAFERIRRLNAQATIIITSGFTRDVSIDQMVEAGAAGYMMKPFNRILLQKTMASVMGD